jgi:hypothetical protein
MSTRIVGDGTEYVGKSLRITLNARNSAALLALSFLMQETHELAHTSVGRVICGCWGPRDFNVWRLCRDCAAEPPVTLLATFAGPAYSFSMIWLGYYLLGRASAAARSLGFALVVSSMPFSRVLTLVFGGGDEVFGLTRLGVDRSIAWPLAVAVVFALAVPPVLRIHRLIDNRPRLLWMVGALLVPFLAVGAVVFAVLQGQVLKRGFLDDTWVLGSPLVVTAWLLVSATVLAVFAKDLTTLLQPAAGAAPEGVEAPAAGPAKAGPSGLTGRRRRVGDCTAGRRPQRAAASEMARVGNAFNSFASIVTSDTRSAAASATNSQSYAEQSLARTRSSTASESTSNSEPVSRSSASRWMLHAWSKVSVPRRR